MEILREHRSREMNVSEIFTNNHSTHAHGEICKLLISNISIYISQINYTKALIPSIGTSLMKGFRYLQRGFLHFCIRTADSKVMESLH